MSRRIEKLIADYPDKVRSRKFLTYQIAHFRGLSANEVIESMYTPRQEGERVQSSSLSDKTAQIAMNYQEHRKRLNSEWLQEMELQLASLSEELDFFEGAIRSLEDSMSRVMECLVIDGMTWDDTAKALVMSYSNVGKVRKKAIRKLEELYALRDRTMETPMAG